MDCRRFRDLHLAYLDDTLSGDDMAQVQCHLLVCDACAAHDIRIRRSMLLVRNLRQIDQPLTPSAGFQQRLGERLAACRAERRVTTTDLRGMGVAPGGVGFPLLTIVPLRREDFEPEDAVRRGLPGWPGRAVAVRAVAVLVVGVAAGAVVWRGVVRGGGVTGRAVNAPPMAPVMAVAPPYDPATIPWVTPARVAPVDPEWPTSTVRAVDHSVVLETH
jgi:anti-sigma factor RsiW